MQLPVPMIFLKVLSPIRITKIPASIRNLTKLNYLFVANGLIGLNDDDLPVELAELPDLTDVEFYNCKFKKFPTALEK